MQHLTAKTAKETPKQKIAITIDMTVTVQWQHCENVPSEKTLYLPFASSYCVVLALVDETVMAL